MASRRKHSKHGPRYIQVFHWVMKTVAWQALTPNERCIYLEVKKRFNGSNNGEIGLGVREAADAIQVGKTTAHHALKRLTELGFIEVVTPSGFNRKNRMATEWLLTEFKNDITGELAKKTFTKWRADEKSTVPSQTPTVPDTGQSLANGVKNHA